MVEQERVIDVGEALAHGLDRPTLEFYQRVIDRLQAAEVPFLVAGAYAYGCYTGIVRHTKDFDVFVRPQHAQAALAALAATGCRCEVTFPHWLGKAFAPDIDAFVDIIYSSGNGVSVVDDSWFAHARPGRVFGRDVLLCAPEEILWTKMLIQERERFDGGDVMHLLRCQGERMDWGRMLERMNSFWRPLFGHLIMFGFVYPGERHQIPRWVMEHLIGRLHAELASPSSDDHVCNGTIISREQYLTDVAEEGYQDGRLVLGTMQPADIQRWTAAIDQNPEPHAPTPPPAPGGPAPGAAPTD